MMIKHNTVFNPLNSLVAVFIFSTYIFSITHRIQVPTLHITGTSSTLLVSMRMGKDNLKL